MNAPLSTAPVAAPGFDEEVARAEIYGLLAQLYYAPPAPDLLTALRAAPTRSADDGGFLEAPWHDLIRESAAMDDTAIVDEYNALFGGMGKPEVYLFGSHYLTGFLNEKPLVGLRDDLAALGLARDPQMPETEDHIAYLCEVMRCLIAGDTGPAADLARQRSFFTTHIQPWVQDMAAAIIAHPRARLYARLAAFTQAFTSVESQGFDMLGD